VSDVQIEYLLPHELRAAVAKRPVAYIPLGTYEWHGEHLPIGLDSLTAHGVCLAAARADGGLVLPPLYYGTGGGHGHYPWTIIKSTPDEIEGQLNFTLQRMEEFGFKLVVLFSGHFADTQLEMIDRVAKDWNGNLKVFAAAVNRIEGLTIGPDHAALFETTLLAALRPDLVHLENLPKTALPADENPFGEQRHDKAHPLYGIFGPDPRAFNPEQAKPLLDASVQWLVAQVHKHI